MIYKNAVADILYYSRDVADEDTPCIVKITGEGENAEIHVEYEDDDEIVIYKGKSLGSGHFSLKTISKTVKGQATLHQIPGGKILEGYWQEDGYKGMWRIKLKE